jgi:hypothetical protein
MPVDAQGGGDVGDRGAGVDGGDGLAAASLKVGGVLTDSHRALSSSSCGDRVALVFGA